MKSIAVSVIAISTVVRLLISFALTPNILNGMFGLGALPAIRASVLDPVHTWDHLDEACFLLQNRVSVWGEEFNRSGYRAVYTPGTRIVAPPLVVAFFGEMFAPFQSSPRVLWTLRRILVLLADIVGAYCIYHIGIRVYEIELGSKEDEIERDTNNFETKEKCIIIPEKLRSLRGWMFGLPTLELDEVGVEESTNADGNTEQEQPKDDQSSKTRQNIYREPILTLGQVPLLVSLLYLSNPVSMIANYAGSLRSIWDALALISLYNATKQSYRLSNEGIPIKVKSASSTSTFLALATYVDVGYAMFLVPILLWRGMMRRKQNESALKIYQRGQSNDWRTVLGLYLCYLLSLNYLASLLVGGSNTEYYKVMAQTMLHNIAFLNQDESGSVPGPSMGLHWYFFVQMFDRFRTYFTIFVAGVPAMFVIPLTIRMCQYPSALAATFQLLWAIFRPTATVHTLTLGLLLAMMNPRTIVRMRDVSLISLFAIPVPILLFITFHRMWLVTGNGNPNYIFFQCFAYGLFVCIISLDFVSATVKRDKVLRMIEKGDTVEKRMADVKEKDSPESSDDLVEKKDDDVKDNVSNASDEIEAKEEEQPNVVFL